MTITDPVKGVAKVTVPESPVPVDPDCIRLNVPVTERFPGILVLPALSIDSLVVLVVPSHEHISSLGALPPPVK